MAVYTAILYSISCIHKHHSLLPPYHENPSKWHPASHNQHHPSFNHINTDISQHACWVCAWTALRQRNEDDTATRCVKSISPSNSPRGFRPFVRLAAQMPTTTTTFRADAAVVAIAGGCKVARNLWCGSVLISDQSMKLMILLVRTVKSWRIECV